MTRRLYIIAALLAVLGAGAWIYTSQTGQTTPFAAATAQNAEDVDTSAVLDMRMGNELAKVTVIEYASFTCPHCKNFHDTAFKDLKKNYIDTGKINFIYREVYFDRFGLWAGMIARCGGPAKYFGISDIIYNTQKDWIAGGDPTLIADNLRKIGKTAGISEADLDTCMNDGQMAQAMVAVYQKNAQADSVDSTPTFIINGTKYSNMNYADFSALLDQKLAE